MLLLITTTQISFTLHRSQLLDTNNTLHYCTTMNNAAYISIDQKSSLIRKNFSLDQHFQHPIRR